MANTTADKLALAATNKAAIKAAIEAKNPTTAPTNAMSQWPTAIASIPSGGGSVEDVLKKEILFFDFDGLIIHSFTVAEVADSDFVMPQLPTYEDMTAQEWNHTLAEVKSQAHGANDWESGTSYSEGDYVISGDFLYRCMSAHVSSGSIDESKFYRIEARMNIGPSVVSNDGKTHYFINLMPGRIPRQYISIQPSNSGDVTVEWGDGSSEVLSESGYNKIHHDYAAAGKYEIKISSSVGTYNIGSTDGDAWGSTYEARNSGGNVYRAVLGSGVRQIGTIGQYAKIASLNIPREVTSFRSQSVFSGSSLKAVVFPHNFITGGYDSGHFTYSDILPIFGANIFGTSSFGSNYGLQLLTVPNTASSLGIFYDSKSVVSVVAPSSLGSHSQDAIASNAFVSASGLVKLDFAQCDSVVPLLRVSDFRYMNENFKIVVPDFLYDDWISATNWSDSTIVGRITKASEYEEV